MKTDQNQIKRHWSSRETFVYHQVSPSHQCMSKNHFWQSKADELSEKKLYNAALAIIHNLEIEESRIYYWF